jgi:hypothetical protein
MLTNDLAVTEIMMLVNEAVVERFLMSVPDHVHGDGTIVGETSLHRRLIYENRRDEAISLFIPTVMLTRRKLEVTSPLQGEQYLPAGHVFQPTIGLDPVPPLAEFSGNVGAAGVPMLIDNGLDKWEIGLCDSPVSYRDGQHGNCISKSIRGRQQKMQGDENYFQRGPAG